MIIAVLSGKGGTGKTTVSTNLAYVRSNTAYVDCDVEEPNGFLFLKPAIKQKEKVNVMVPSISDDKCKACGECVKWCQFNVLALAQKKVISFLQLCHGCGLCSMVCPENAISEVPREIGVVETGEFEGRTFMHGILNMGEPMPVPIINKLIKKAEKLDAEQVIVDSPPGSSCSVIASVEQSDFCLLVTEPTPFGLHDLKIAVQLIKSLKKPCGVIINKADTGSHIIKEYCESEEIPVLLEIPFSKKFAEAYSAGKMLVQVDPVLKRQFEDLLNRIGEGIK